MKKKKNVYAFLTKNTFPSGLGSSNSQATYKKELYLVFEKLGNFFHRANVQIDLAIFLTVFVFVRFLRTPLPPSEQMYFLNAPIM